MKNMKKLLTMLSVSTNCYYKQLCQLLDVKQKQVDTTDPINFFIDEFSKKLQKK